MNAPRRCRALLVSAPASGQGKTTVTAALAWRQRKNGQRVRVFKTGPDFLDPMILERASGQPVYQLDLWMGDEDHCRGLLYEAAGESDLILIEGVMGLHDGRPSSADLAARFGVPVLAVIDASAMAQTFSAVAFGLARFRDDIPFLGVFANRVAGAGHAGLLGSNAAATLPLRGWLTHDPAISLPGRHLGLTQAAEVSDLDARLAQAAQALHWAEDLPIEPVEFTPGRSGARPPRLLENARIAVARDAAFAFVYRANLDTLSALGARLHFFSPLADDALPDDADGLYLPGGYPELHLSALANNRAMRRAIHDHHARGKPILAECGGLLYLLESLTDADGRRAEMLGLLPGHAVMQRRLGALALQRLDLPEGTLRGHTFHYSRLETPLEPIVRATCPHGGATAEAVFRSGRLTASYVHSYFPSNPVAAARLFLP